MHNEPTHRPDNPWLSADFLHNFITEIEKIGNKTTFTASKYHQIWSSCLLLSVLISDFDEKNQLTFLDCQNRTLETKITACRTSIIQTLIYPRPLILIVCQFKLSVYGFESLKTLPSEKSPIGLKGCTMDLPTDQETLGSV